MADAAQPGATTNDLQQRPRRSSLRKNSTECGLPPGYLDALESKRRSLDESIHKFIASKEREYKQYEKDLKHQVRRAESSNHGTQTSAQSASASAVGSLLQRVTTGDGAGAAKHTRVDLQSLPIREQHKSNQEDFPGVFTPEYLSLLAQDDRHKSASRQNETSKISPVNTPALTHDTFDPGPSNGVVRPLRLKLNHRTSSSGSSVDGKLVSAMKSPSETSQPKRKRVSIAVGDAIVAPSDNVPVALSVNSSSSHSRARVTRRDTPASTPETPPISLLQPIDARAATSPAAQVAIREVRSMAAASKPASTPNTQDDIGDMFDLDDSDMLDSNDAVEQPEFGSGSADSLEDEIAIMPASLHKTSSDIHLDPGEPPPIEPEDELQDVPLTPIIGAGASSQPADAGFRRPSAISDPIYQGMHASHSTTDDEIYSSSFSRPTSKGSFTSGSLGESYMARNAAAMMEMRSQQPSQEENVSRHRQSHSGTVLPVR